jgi:hypothetical protein
MKLTPDVNDETLFFPLSVTFRKKKLECLSRTSFFQDNLIFSTFSSEALYLIPHDFGSILPY